MAEVPQTNHVKCFMLKHCNGFMVLLYIMVNTPLIYIYFFYKAFTLHFKVDLFYVELYCVYTQYVYTYSDIV